MVLRLRSSDQEARANSAQPVFWRTTAERVFFSRIHHLQFAKQRTYGSKTGTEGKKPGSRSTRVTSRRSPREKWYRNTSKNGLNGYRYLRKLLSLDIYFSNEWAFRWIGGKSSHSGGWNSEMFLEYTAEIVLIIIPA